jgi:hypothetical protein
MKALLSTLLLFVCLTVTAQDKTKIQVVEVSCGQCQFGMKATGCALAVRLDGKSYFVDGTTLDEHGDAHAEDGFCNAVRQAEVIGEVKDGRFVVTYFKLLPLKK